MSTHTGGCHCKKVRYEAQIDLTQPVLECNCSHCSIKGVLWSFMPADHFKLTEGEEYLFNKQTIKHQFCKVCGVEPLAYGENDGQKTVALNVRTVDDVDFSALTRTPVDGKSF